MASFLTPRRMTTRLGTSIISVLYCSIDIDLSKIVLNLLLLDNIDDGYTYQHGTDSSVSTFDCPSKLLLSIEASFLRTEKIQSGQK